MKVRNILSVMLCMAVAQVTFAQDVVKKEVKREVKEIKKESKELKQEAKESAERMSETGEKAEGVSEKEIEREREATRKAKEMKEEAYKERQAKGHEKGKGHENSKGNHKGHDHGTGEVDGEQRGVAVREAGISKEERITRQRASYDDMAKRQVRMDSRLEMTERKMNDKLAKGEVSQEVYDEKMVRLKELKERMAELENKSKKNQEKFSRSVK